MYETNDMSDDDELPWHEKAEEEKRLALEMIATAFNQIMGLLQFDRYETVVFVVKCLGETMRQKPPAELSDDESMEAESDEQKAQRYANCGMSEASDPDFWQELHYGPRPPTPAEDTGLMQF